MKLRQERGTGLLGTTFGLAIMIALLGFAVNVTLGLWTRSTVDSVAYDAARRVATSASGDGTGISEQNAIADAKVLLGEFGAKVRMNFVTVDDPDLVVLRVQAPGVSLLPKVIGGGPIIAGIDRQIVIRREGR
ncbi:MAG TPA: hypothetical protein VL068_07745 [Microthrixaceae bacterium]|nr:hypothetical protein [Microthrixaceae bacterium]